MTHKLNLAFLVFFQIFFIFFPATAKTTLKPAEIEQYLTSLNQIQALMAHYNSQTDGTEETQLDNMPTPPDPMSQTPITDNLKRMKSHPTFSTFEEIIINIGFENSKEWAATGDRIMSAYSAHQFKISDAQNPVDIEEVRSDLNEQLSAVKNNQFISNEQKRTLINKIEKSIALITDPNYIENENILIIKPYIERLNSLLRITNDTY